MLMVMGQPIEPVDIKRIYEGDKIAGAFYQSRNCVWIWSGIECLLTNMKVRINRFKLASGNGILIAINIAMIGREILTLCPFKMHS